LGRITQCSSIRYEQCRPTALQTISPIGASALATKRLTFQFFQSSTEINKSASLNRHGLNELALAITRHFFFTAALIYCTAHISAAADE
jgi:hypothetical protein